jgi:transglutaminase-like putative cysteine protease
MPDPGAGLPRDGAAAGPVRDAYNDPVSIHVALSHVTHYRFDREVALGPHLVRLRPAPHCRTRILAYSLRVDPAKHFLNWQQDPQSNFVARLVFPERARELRVAVDLVVEMAVHNPFDFFLEPAAERFPFAYDAAMQRDLAPYLATLPASPRFDAFVAGIARDARPTADFLVDLNLRLAREIRYLIRLEPGVQSPETTLSLGSGSCRDSGWLLVQLLRRLGLAARFVSGYLIQLVPDVKSLDGPSGPAADFTRRAGLPARRRLDRARPDLRPAGRRGARPAGGDRRAVGGGAGQRRARSL